MSAAVIPISAELAAWVAVRTAPDHLSEIIAGFATSQIETLPAARRHLIVAPQPSLSEDFRRRHGFWSVSRRPRRSRDRQISYEHRHRLAWSGALPGFLAARLTVADMAVARILFDQHARRIRCDLSIDEIADRVMVCRKTVKRALSRMHDERLIAIEERPIKGRKNLTNIVRIISREWLSWIEKRSKPTRERPTGGHLVAPSDTTVRKLGEEETNKRQTTRPNVGGQRHLAPVGGAPP